MDIELKCYDVFKISDLSLNTLISIAKYLSNFICTVHLNGMIET